MVVAMSGGVDSSVVAAMLKAEGYDVIGITLQLYDHGMAVSGGKTCCAGQDIADAKRVAEQIGIPHYVLNYESRFREAVIDDFIETYLAGQTPIPCVRCNQSVKFKDLLATARDLKADVMATGHYVRRNAQGEMLRGVEQGKDQSYFLFATTREQLDFLRFPLGDKRKEETRALAQCFGLQVAEKPDSQDICFVPTGDYAGLVQKIRPDAAQPGEIVLKDGTVIGQHEGIIHFTVGQRRGIGIGGGDALYVVALDAATNRVIVGPREELLVEAFSLKDLNWLPAKPIAEDGSAVLVKVRSASTPVPAKIWRKGTGGMVVLNPPQAGIAPGQACVFYEGDKMLGGGWIEA